MSIHIKSGTAVAWHGERNRFAGAHLIGELSGISRVTVRLPLRFLRRKIYLALRKGAGLPSLG